MREKSERGSGPVGRDPYPEDLNRALRLWKSATRSVGAAESSLPGKKGGDDRESQESQDYEWRRDFDQQARVHSGLFHIFS